MDHWKFCARHLQNLTCVRCRPTGFRSSVGLPTAIVIFSKFRSQLFLKSYQNELYYVIKYSSIFAASISNTRESAIFEIRNHKNKKTLSTLNDVENLNASIVCSRITLLNSSAKDLFLQIFGICFVLLLLFKYPRYCNIVIN